MDDCIFCKINSNAIQGQIISSNDQANAFLDVTPISKGHTLVVPKRHVETILDLESNELHGLIDLIKEATSKIKNTLKPDGFNIGTNMHQAGGQKVEHLHIHVIPRWLGDGGSSMHSLVNKPPQESLEEILNKINIS